MQTTYLAITLQYSRKFKGFRATVRPADHIAVQPNVYFCEDSNQGVYSALGMLVAGKFGPTETAKRIELARCLTAYVGNTVHVFAPGNDSIGFSAN